MSKIKFNHGNETEVAFVEIGEVFTGEILPIFEQMEFTELASIIGIDYLELQDVISKRKNSIAKDMKRDLGIKTFKPEVERLMNKVDEMVENLDFKRKLISKILFMRDYGKIIYEDGKLIGYYKGKDKKYCLELSFDNDNVKYLFNDNKIDNLLVGCYDKKVTGESLIEYYEKYVTAKNLKDRLIKKFIVAEKNYSYDKDGNQIAIDEYRENEEHCINKQTGESAVECYKQRVIVEDLNDKLVNDITFVKENLLYDKDGYQMCVDECRQYEKYYIDKQTGKKTICEFEAKNSVKERAGCYIIRRVTKQDNVLGTNSEGYLIAKNLQPQSKELPTGGNFEQISKEMYEKYLNNECSIEELWENRNKTFFISYGCK